MATSHFHYSPQLGCFAFARKDGHKNGAMRAGRLAVR